MTCTSFMMEEDWRQENEVERSRTKGRFRNVVEKKEIINTCIYNLWSKLRVKLLF